MNSYRSSQGDLRKNSSYADNEYVHPLLPVYPVLRIRVHHDTAAENQTNEGVHVKSLCLTYSNGLINVT